MEAAGITGTSTHQEHMSKLQKKLPGSNLALSSFQSTLMSLSMCPFTDSQLSKKIEKGLFISQMSQMKFRR